MGKRKIEETKEERKERKRLKKEAKKPKICSQRKDITPRPTANREGGVAGSEGFYRKRLELSVSLLPGSLGDAKKNVEESIQTLQLKYSDGVGGILLSFDDLKILDSGNGLILNELPYIHYRVATTALVFSPRMGSTLEGVVTDSFHSHISLVVCGYFNASISAENLRSSGFEFDQAEEQWRTQAEATAVAKDSKVVFTCKRMHESGGLISIEGVEAAVQ